MYLSLAPLLSFSLYDICSFLTLKTKKSQIVWPQIICQKPSKVEMDPTFAKNNHRYMQENMHSMTLWEGKPAVLYTVKVLHCAD